MTEQAIKKDEFIENISGVIYKRLKDTLPDEALENKMRNKAIDSIEDWCKHMRLATNGY